MTDVFFETTFGKEPSLENVWLQNVGHGFGWNLQIALRVIQEFPWYFKMVKECFA